jgi:hypothetical protein
MMPGFYARMPDLCGGTRRIQSFRQLFGMTLTDNRATTTTVGSPGVTSAGADTTRHQCVYRDLAYSCEYDFRLTQIEKGSGVRVTLSKLILFAEDGSEGFCFFLEDASDVRSNIGFLGRAGDAQGYAGNFSRGTA